MLHKLSLSDLYIRLLLDLSSLFLQDDLSAGEHASTKNEHPNSAVDCLVWRVPVYVLPIIIYVLSCIEGIPIL